MADRHDEFSWRRFSIGVARRLGIRTGHPPDEDLHSADEDAWSSGPAVAVDNALTQLLAEHWPDEDPEDYLPGIAG